MATKASAQSSAGDAENVVHYNHNILSVLCCQFWFWPKEERVVLLTAIVESRPWRVVNFYFTIINLFGAQFKDLWIPKEADFAMDILFTVQLVFFCIDMLIRIEIEPNYFVNFCCWPKTVDEELGIFEDTDDARCKWSNCSFGSFVFWCEMQCTLAILYEITYINPFRNEEIEINISLDEWGTPINGLEDSLNAARSIQYENLELFVVICKSARIARFIRSTSAVELSSRIPWYAIMDALNPLNWINYIRGRCAPASKAGTQRGLQRRKSELLRENDWGSLGIGLLAFIKENRKTEEEKAAERRQRRSLKGRTQQLLRFLGFLPNDDEMWRRQIAATKIQRAWRKVLQNRYIEDDSMEPSEKSEREVSTRSRVTTNKASEQYNASSATKTSDDAKNPTTDAAGDGHDSDNKKSQSTVGSAMRELTGQRVAVGIMAALVFTVFFTYTEKNATRPATMIVLHGQTMADDFAFANKSLDVARESVIPDLYYYQLINGEYREYELDDEDPDELRDRERLIINVTSQLNGTDVHTIGYFAYRKEMQNQALALLLSHIFILIVWFAGVTAFAGPVMSLVAIPIERMVKLLGMLMKDPLGYESTARYRKFVADEDKLIKNTKWTKEVLKGMETSFLMTTITRIGSLMKVGFGTAGVEIIRQNLEKGRGQNTMLLNEKGATVSRIFLFCDIRQFTDATESLQEEVFVFTNRVAAVVHSICHAYGGAANKNIGDAFLMSWKLDESPSHSEGFTARSNQADKALLSVVKICLALYHNEFYTGTLSDGARQALLAKIAGRKGPVVQMGCGLHAGKAVQGAIGSQRKIDPTYVSEACERAEFLESSTKKYGVKMLMSNNFHRLLHPSTRRRCRKVDQLLIPTEDEDQDDDDDDDLKGFIMELFTFDIDIDALWRPPVQPMPESEHESDSESTSQSGKKLTRQQSGRKVRRRSGSNAAGQGAEDASESGGTGGAVVDNREWPPKLVLPTGPTMYNPSVWVNDEIKVVRERYSDGLFFQKFNTGFQAFYSKDWDQARQCFASILERFEDGPSRYFFNQIEKHGGKPPNTFCGYGTA